MPTRTTASLTSDVDNDGWFDDTADGPVNATIVFEDGTTSEVAGAWASAACAVEVGLERMFGVFGRGGEGRWRFLQSDAEVVGDPPWRGSAARWCAGRHAAF